jgi:riboflavin kinase / FMN adenylyltransferase
MKVISNPGQVKPPKHKPRILVIGVFDGVHVGHQKLIHEALARSRALRGELWVMTFDPHPVHVLRPEVNLPLIISLPHRLYLLSQLGARATVVLPFSRSMASLTPRSFIKKYLVDCVVPREIFVGDDFRFGQKRLGSIDDFLEEGRKRGFTASVVPSLPGDIGKVSSTRIRHWIVEGNLRKAARFLGRPVAVMGKVVKGESRGRRLGFPTANLSVDDELLPPRGVYAVDVEIGGGRHRGMTNIGQRPTFTPLDEKIFIETHIFNFEQNLYGKTIIIHFLKKIRDERKFSSELHLCAQLKKDRRQAEMVLRHGKTLVD